MVWLVFKIHSLLEEGANATTGQDAATGPSANVMTGQDASTGPSANATTGQDAATGSGANAMTGQSAATGPGANVRRFQGEALGLRSRQGHHQLQQQHRDTPAPPVATTQHYDISTPPTPMVEAPTTSQRQPRTTAAAAPAQVSTTGVLGGSEMALHQLAEQRSALVAALHARASRVIGSTGSEGVESMTTMEAGEIADATGDQMVWFARIRNMVQRGLDRMLMQPGHGEIHGDQSSTGSLQPEVVQEEVRKAVQLAMQSRDTKVSELQNENAELKQLLMAMIDVSAEGAGGGARPTVVNAQGASGDVGVNLGEAGVSGLLPVYLCLPVENMGIRQDNERGMLYVPGVPVHQELIPKAATAKMLQEGQESDGVDGLTGPRQQLQLKKDFQDPELLKGNITLPVLPEPYQDSSAVMFLEWIYEAGQLIGSITDKATSWWLGNLELEKMAYYKFQAETPLKRLSITVGNDVAVDGEKWIRLERRVMALLLAAMNPSIKAEITMMRIDKVKSCLFKLFTIYAPGGASERASLIKQLEHIQPQNNVVEMIAALHKWKKLIGRAAEMGVSLPDGSVLLVALEAAIKNLTENNKDISFKLNMAKSELGLPYKPALSAVLTYADHVIAELQQVIPFGNQIAKLKGANVDPRTPSSSTSPTGKGQGQKQQPPCKFWSTDEGCRRGANCKFTHAFASKEDKKARCWTCGATNHRQAECPTKSGGKRGSKGSSEKRSQGEPTSPTATTPQIASLNNPMPSTMQVPTPSTSATSTLEHPSRAAISTATTTSPSTTLDPSLTQQPTSSGTSSAASTVLFQDQSNTGEIRELAEQFLAKIKRLAPMQTQTDNAVVDLELLLRSQGFNESQGMALLDSGASHPFRVPKSLEERTSSRRVQVQLADGKTISLRQNSGGTLLAENEQGGTILPLGSLVSSLGCELQWSRKRGLQVRHPRHGLLPTKLVGNTPVLREAEALQLISDLEEVELQKLRAQTTEGVIKTLVTDETPTTWLDHLEEFVATGKRACLRRMLMDEEAPIKAATEEEIAVLVGVEEKIMLSDEAGAFYLKSLPYNRATRKRMLRTRWIVHLFNGDEQGPEFTYAESDDVMVVRMDVRTSKGFDLRMYGPAARALLWAAARGQIEGVIGGPPRGSEHGSTLFKRLMLTWLVANSGAVQQALCAPHFTMEAPTWHPIWTSSAWLNFRDELRFMKYHSVAVQGNMYFLASSLEVSQGMSIEEAEIITLNNSTPASSWPTTLKAGLAQSMVSWRRSDLRRHEATLCKVVGSRDLNAKDLAYWQNHIKNNHVPYDKRCRTCVRASATGRAHRRCLTPSSYSLSLDICGPMRTRGESPDGKGYRYLLVGAYSHPKLELPRDVKLPPVEEEEDVEPELDPFEEEDIAPRPEDADDEEQKAMNERYKEIYRDIGDDIECQTLHFVVPNGYKAKETRTWMADRDILATTGESQQPQQNGRAEALVRDVKRRVKVLLRAAHLPMSCWPLAAEFAARRQRDLALGNHEDKDLPFGAPTHVKHKQFGQGGRYDLLERWCEGVFVGYSNDVKNGRVVRHTDGTYTTSVHIKPYLFDPGDLVEFGPYEMELPVLNGEFEDLLDHQKFTLDDVVGLWNVLRTKARPTTRTTQGEGLQWLVGQYTYGSLCGVVRDTDLYPVATVYLVQAFKKLTGHDDFTSLSITEDVGMTCHRDVHNHGQRNNVLLPVLQCDSGGGVWIESQPRDYDYADEWKELPRGGWRRGRVHELQRGVPIEINPKMYHSTEPWTGKRLVVTTYTPRTTKTAKSTYDILCNYGFNPPPLQPQVPNELQRAVLKMMTMDDKREPDAVMFLVNEVEEENRERARDVSRELCQLQDDVLAKLRERQEWLKEFLAEEEILAEELQVVGETIKEEIEGINGAVRDLLQDVEEKIKLTEEKCHSLYLKVANVTDETNIGDIEEHLANLKKDLDVTLDVPLDQVKANMDKWVEPMSKELSNLEEKTNAIERKTIQEARQMERDGLLVLIPGKVVFTVKPPPPLSEAEQRGLKTPRWKRKARIVICGNMASQKHDPNDLFAAGASVEGLRLGLALASARLWIAAATDVSAAFLQALWPEGRPTYGVLPPKVLVQSGLVSANVVFIVKRALYGLRESPALWSAHRTSVLKKIKVKCGDGFMWLKQLATDGELWMVLWTPDGGIPQLVGLLVTYVDDLLYLANKDTILRLHEVIATTWPCSPLEFSTEGLRYLGMELFQEEAVITLGQEAYVSNLVRLHNLDSEVSSGLPCPREWIQDDDDNGEDVTENYSDDELRKAQKITGECLWLAYRTRPDILYITNYMASMTSKRPVKVHQVGKRVISYLNATKTLKLKAEAEAEITQAATEITQATAEITQATAGRNHQAGFRVSLSGFSDASFAPYGGKSFGCSLVMVGKTPVTWKAGKQPMVAMSVCEAELMEGSNCALLLESVQAMLQEILPTTAVPVLNVDNQAACNILTGSVGSWRTRHLRIRHAYVLDRVGNGGLSIQHLAGEDQPADLPTKLHSRARLLHLLGIWGMVGLPGLDEARVLKGLKLGCMFLLLLAIQSLAVSAEKDPLPRTGTTELLLMVILTCISTVAIWETGRALGKWLLPMCCETRKMKRIRKLKELARVAAEAEVERWVDVDAAQITVTHEAQITVTHEAQITVTNEDKCFREGQTSYPTDDGLVAEGLPVTGIKCDLVRRLSDQLGAEPTHSVDLGGLGYPGFYFGLVG
ncbi:RE1 [Symbiodinium sp. CCMP2456]|nr:RE1 [Symbiodinium sp. CCMP2456]